MHDDVESFTPVKFEGDKAAIFLTKERSKTTQLALFLFFVTFLRLVDSKRNPYSRIEQKHCCTCNMGKRLQISISSVSQTKELITDTGNRDQVSLATPLGLFSNLPLPITSCVKTYETYEIELWWLLLLADISRRQNVEVSKCDRFCPGNLIVWSLDMSREFP